MLNPEFKQLNPPQAKTLARDIVDNGLVDFSGHALEEMRNDELETTDCLNVLRGGTYEPAEFIKGEWRYRVTTRFMCFVITFKSNTKLRVVTGWRFK